MIIRRFFTVWSSSLARVSLPYALLNKLGQKGEWVIKNWILAKMKGKSGR